jgi:hypothetical protein
MARMTLDELVSQLRAAYGSALHSIVLYGSAAAGEHNPKKSDYNVLVIVDALDAARLTAASAASRAWAESGNPAPLTLTTAEWRGSSDIFPMEYADILERHRVLYGAAPFDGIKVQATDLRLQLEHEAMGKLLKLRQSVLASAGDDKRLLELMAASASAIMVIFRAVCRLHAVTPDRDNAKLVEQVATLTHLDPQPFQHAVDVSRGGKAVPPAGALATVEGYVAGMEKLVAYLDRYSG